ncbi:MAG: hypothetical protein LLF76_01970 [Planctomycetaceae bacterium]|nr:hypothetical protein [Planctomycetaceae bacterium]
MTSQARNTLKAISFAGLVLSVVPAFLFFGGVLSKQIYLHLMTAGMLMWFGSAIFWVRKDDL